MDDQKNNLSLAEIVEKSFDFSAYSEKEKAELIDETSNLIMEAALLRALGDGGDEVQEKFNAFMDSEPDDIAMNDYIQKELPKFQDYIIEELKALKDLGEVSGTEK